VVEQALLYRGRTVLAFLILAMVASSILTLTITQSNLLDPRGKTAPASVGVTTATGLTNKDLTKLATTFNLIENKYVAKVDHDKLMSGAINGMLNALDDPFTAYMDEKEAKQFSDTISSSFQGIGAEVSLEEGKVTVISPIKGSPAEKAGVHANDVILSVNGDKLDGLSLNQAVLKIRGPKGTQAKLDLVRPGVSDMIQLTIVRDEIDVETVFGEMMDNNIGKIEIRQFATNTAVRFKEELKTLESKGMKGLVIDVRNDPGGLLNVVEEILQQFVPKDKALYQIEDRDGKKVPTLSIGSGKPYPVTVLINGGSASASEILAGAFQEAVGSKLIGEKTFGKGTVQVTFEKEMGDGSNLKMTVFKWLTPNGNWIHKKGIEPDIAVEQPSYFKAVPMSKKVTLKADMNGEEVKNLQLMLRGLGYDPKRVDGYFSSDTAAAVKAFQSNAKVAQTGEVTAELAGKIEKAVQAAIKSPQNDLQLKAAVEELQKQMVK
jgi:carboxyl-terminal processing protease